MKYLSAGNSLFLDKKFAQAVELYLKAAAQYPFMVGSLKLNIRLAIRYSDVEYDDSRLEWASLSVIEPELREAFGLPQEPLIRPEKLEQYHFDKIVESGLFDPAYYRKQCAGELSEGSNPLEHYLDVGISKGYNPSVGFNTNFYKKHNPDVVKAGMNPFIHYVCNGQAEGRDAVPESYQSRYEVAPVEYIPRMPKGTPPPTMLVKPICFYLPQFHAIPENDEWWGKGFTEWTNVKPAKPQFEGHYQPHVPHEDMGYYNLLDRETQAKQIELAKQYGIGGFCYYLYWFSGTRLLDQPIDNMLADPTLDFPFCVCWANENWSRRWDGLDHDLLMVQEYSDEDDIAFITNISKYLKDDRYIRVDGKPLLVIYRPNLFPDMRSTVRRWRRWCRNNGVGEIYLAYPQSFEKVDPAVYDFDAALEFPPNNSKPPNITNDVTPVVEDFQAKVYDWRIFVERSDDYEDPGYTLFRSATPAWDNTARKKNKGTVFHNSCPKLFTKYLRNAFSETLAQRDNPDERLVFINAWNEWAEGAHLEPDQRYGYAWLDSVYEAHSQLEAEVNGEVQNLSVYLDRKTVNYVKKNGLFNAAWYMRQYQGRYKIDGDPLHHYLNVGVAEGLNPSQNFNTSYYLETNPDVAAADVNPFVHYVTNGAKEGRAPLPPSPAYEIPEPKYIERLPSNSRIDNKLVNVICFYLPQFHSIPENDKWWGKGFTEWTNTESAKPLFEGHYQPHTPHPDIGYYNLLDRETQSKQIELAKQYGIGGFCYYFYWFSGKRLLEQPLDNVLEDPSLDFPFCICWANENWSRRWDGMDHELLMVQEYSDDDDIEFIKECGKYLRDKRYIRIDGKPLLLIYRPNLFPDMVATVKRWREWCRKSGIGEIYLAYPQSFSDENPSNFGFDAAIEFPPSGWYARQQFAQNIKPRDEDFEASVYDWRFMLKKSENYELPEYKLFRGLTPSWDNTARRKSRATVFHNAAPELFERWLINAFEDTVERFDNQDERVVFVNAWNEWAEGAHLEPDEKYGYAWLQSVYNAHKEIEKKKRRLLLVGHDALTHGAQLLLLNIMKEYRCTFQFEIDVIVLGGGPLLSKYSKYAKVHVIQGKDCSSNATFRLLNSIRKSGASTAVVNTTVSGSLVGSLKASGFNVVSLIHELPSVLGSFNLDAQARMIEREADAVVFPAEQVKTGFETFIGRTVRQGMIRPQGLYFPSLLREGASKEELRVEVRKELGIDVDAKLVMCAGYADYRKGFDIFVRVCASVMRSREKVYALWVGHMDDALVKKSMEYASALKLEHKFIFTGLIEDPRKYYIASDVYALTSREDPFPSVVMESLDALTPVVAFKECGGFETLLSRGCGDLVSKGSEEDFGAALLRMIDSPDRCVEMAAIGRNIVAGELSFHHYLYDLLAFGGEPLPKISVVVPNFNYENYIRDRLDSIINQTYPIYELIVLDDFSTDNSVQVIKDWLKGCGVPSKLVVNDTNSGSVFSQWKKGSELAKGDYLWIAEADDLADPGFLEELVGSLSDPEVVLAFSQSKQIDQNDDVIDENYLSYTADVGDYWQCDYVVEGRTEIVRALSVKNTIPNVSGAVFKVEPFREAMQAAWEDLKSYKVAGDWRLYFEILRAGRIAFRSKSLNMHRRHVSSVTKVNDHFDEVVGMQDLVQSNYKLGKDVKEKIESYRRFLEDYFQR